MAIFAGGTSQEQGLPMKYDSRNAKQFEARNYQSQVIGGRNEHVQFFLL